MKWIALGTLTGWAGIVWLAWWLANDRARLCPYSEERCRLAATATRDAVLTNGLTVALVGLAGVAVLVLLRKERLNVRPGQPPREANQARQAKRLP